MGYDGNTFQNIVTQNTRQLAAIGKGADNRPSRPELSRI
jgi:hypothetical protein